ncbi:MAG: M48 family metallopeptidase [Candidatus Kapaibacteriales bacterium]
MADFEYTLKRSNRKSIGLKITSDAELVITAPYLVTNSQIKRVLESKKSWIEKKLISAENRLSESNFVKFVESGEILYKGERKTITFDSLSKKSIFIDDSLIKVSEDLTQNLKHNLEQYLRYQAKLYSFSMAAHIATANGLKYSGIRINNPSKRWGSCSSRGNINLCWRLIMAPEVVFRYVIAHELAHTVHLNHSKEYWNLVSEIHPTYKNEEKWLDDKGHLLTW